MPHRNKYFKLTIMGKKAKKSHLAGIPAWALSLSTLGVSIIFMIIFNNIIYSLNIIDHSLFEIIAAIFICIWIVVAIFIICRTHPKSVWYTPIICNALGIIVAILDPNFWTQPISILLGSCFVLSVIGAIVGARIGRRIINQA